MRAFLLAAAILVPCLAAAEPGGTNAGKAMFRSNCAFCHGLTARGGRGPNLVTTRLAQTSDEAIVHIIHEGISGTTMPAFPDFTPDEAKALVSFLRGLAGSGAESGTVPGNPAHGKQLYAQNGCAGCHRVGGEGGIFGPELTRVGSARSLEYLRQSIVDPGADIPEEYEAVTVTTKAGRKITGVRLNEDTFSLQLRKPDGGFLLLDKSDLSSVRHDKTSAMPAYKSLPAADLTDLVAYLASLRGASAGGDVTKAKGIQ